MLNLRPAVCGSPGFLSSADAEEEFWKETRAILALKKVESYKGGATPSGYPEITRPNGTAVVPYGAGIALCMEFGQDKALAVDHALEALRRRQSPATHDNIRQIIETTLFGKEL